MRKQSKRKTGIPEVFYNKIEAYAYKKELPQDKKLFPFNRQRWSGEEVKRDAQMKPKVWKSFFKISLVFSALGFFFQ